MTALPLAFGILIAGAILLGFIGLWRLSRTEDAVEARLREYGGMTAALPGSSAPSSGPRARRLNGLLKGTNLAASFGERLARADLALTVAEFLLIAAAIAAGLALLGWWRGGPSFALALGAVGLFLPILYLNSRTKKRREAFTNQLPDVLTLLVGALRAGHGITQAIGTLVERAGKPASTEFARVLRAVSLGMPVNRALNDMADRVASDDLFLVVTAMNVQAELGGNLAQILETITETVRERIRIKREIRVLTAQQRMTGYLLAGLPIVVGFVLTLMRPDYLKPLFAPGMMRLVLIGTVLMMIVGFLIIRKIVDIEV